MARGVRRRHLPASKWGRRRIVLSGPTLPPSISMSGAQSCRRQEACGQVDSRSAPDHFPTGPTTTEAVNSSGTQTGQLHRHQNHTPPKTANTRGSRPSSTAAAPRGRLHRRWPQHRHRSCSQPPNANRPASPTADVVRVRNGEDGASSYRRLRDKCRRAWGPPEFAPTYYDSDSPCAEQPNLAYF